MLQPASETSKRLSNAVHRSKAISLQGMLERLFTLAFHGLVYPQIWEDPEVDMEALALGPDSRMITIASGGCNVLSYLVADPNTVWLGLEYFWKEKLYILLFGCATLTLAAWRFQKRLG